GAGGGRPRGRTAGAAAGGGGGGPATPEARTKASMSWNSDGTRRDVGPGRASLQPQKRSGTGAAASASGGWMTARGGGGKTGSTTSKVDPWPSTLWTRTTPPWPST